MKSFCQYSVLAWSSMMNRVWPCAVNSTRQAFFGLLAPKPRFIRSSTFCFSTRLSRKTSLSSNLKMPTASCTAPPISTSLKRAVISSPGGMAWPSATASRCLAMASECSTMVLPLWTCVHRPCKRLGSFLPSDANSEVKAMLAKGRRNNLRRNCCSSSPLITALKSLNTLGSPSAPMRCSTNSSTKASLPFTMCLC